MSKEKRRSERRSMFRVCRYSIEGRAYADLSTNISDRGIFVKNSSPPAVGTLITLNVTLPEEWGNLPLEIVGRVAWVEDGEDHHKRGMGLEFLSVRADSLPIIEYFVREVYQKEKLEELKLHRDAGSAAYEYELDIEVDEKRSEKK